MCSRYSQCLKITQSVTFEPLNLFFKKSLKLPGFGIFNELLSSQNVKEARFARNIECDFSVIPNTVSSKATKTVQKFFRGHLDFSQNCQIWEHSQNKKSAEKYEFKVFSKINFNIYSAGFLLSISLATVISYRSQKDQRILAIFILRSLATMIYTRAKKCQSVTGFKNVEGVLSKHLKVGCQHQFSIGKLYRISKLFINTQIFDHELSVL